MILARQTTRDLRMALAARQTTPINQMTSALQTTKAAAAGMVQAAEKKNESVELRLAGRSTHTAAPRFFRQHQVSLESGIYREIVVRCGCR